MTTDGDGFVVSQLPAPGEFVEAGGAGVIRLRRQPVAEGSVR
jgi:hypothetical protein